MGEGRTCQGWSGWRGREQAAGASWGAQTLTPAAGVPGGAHQHALTAGRRGPLLLHDLHLMDKMAPCNRERIPARIVHAKGLGASSICTMTNLRCRGLHREDRQGAQSDVARLSGADRKSVCAHGDLA
jgi:Catalase